jgi:hypothetical protein
LNLLSVKFRPTALALACALAFAAAADAQQSYTRQIPAGGTANVQSPATAPGTSTLELDPAFAGGDTHDGGNDATGSITINRPVNPNPHPGNAHANAGQRAKSNPEINLSFDGLNFFQQRFADNGNQFSVEPPDQGLCAGNGYVLESTNDVLNIFNTSGISVLPGGKAVSLNQFYGYASAINRSTGQYGPSLTDPSCYFDQATQRWFHVVLTLDRVGTSSRLSGSNHLDLAVSQSANPLGNWTVYRIPVQDDGSQGTPNHHCAGGPCLGDYPHIGADANGVYLTTNEFPFFAGGYHGAQIYAISKQALVSTTSSLNVVQYDTGAASTNTASGLPGFTVWPAISALSSPTQQGGIEYLLSSLAIFQDSGVSNQLQLWSLTGTSALLNGGAPTLTSSLVTTEPYGIPGMARQPGTGTDGVGKAPGGGNVNWPLGQCLNDPSCAPALIGSADPFTEVIGALAGNDSRMQQVYYANGKLWASLGTGIAYDTPQTTSDGLAFFVLHPQADSGTPTATVVQQGYVADPALDLTYGTVAVTESGRGVLSFTATGPNNYPSVGYTSLDAKIGAGPVHISTAGAGVQDGFTEYDAFGGNPPRPRWGDYGAATVDGNSIWFAQEYIGQSCTLAEYEAAPFGRCANTRGSLGNWDTRITKVTP